MKGKEKRGKTMMSYADVIQAFYLASYLNMAHYYFPRLKIISDINSQVRPLF